MSADLISSLTRGWPRTFTVFGLGLFFSWGFLTTVEFEAGSRFGSVNSLGLEGWLILLALPIIAYFFGELMILVGEALVALATQLRVLDFGESSEPRRIAIVALQENSMITADYLVLKRREEICLGLSGLLGIMLALLVGFYFEYEWATTRLAQSISELLIIFVVILFLVFLLMLALAGARKQFDEKLDAFVKLKESDQPELQDHHRDDPDAL